MARLYRWVNGQWVAPAVREEEPPGGGPDPDPVSHGREINASNTGHSGTLEVIQNDQVGLLSFNQAWLDQWVGGAHLIEGKELRNFNFGGFGSTDNLNVTFRNCKFVSCSFDMPGVRPGLTIEYSTIVGTTTPGDYTWSNYAFIHAGNFTLRRNNIFGYGAGTIHCVDDVTIEENFIHDPAPWQPGHLGGGAGDPTGSHHGLTTLQFGSCERVIIRRNRYQAWRGSASNPDTAGVSAALTIYDDSFHPGPIVVEDNYFGGGGFYNTYWGSSSKPAPPAEYVISRGNIFGRDIHRFCGSGGPLTAWSWTTGRVWENNRWGPRGPHWQNGDPEEGDLIIL